MPFLSYAQNAEDVPLWRVFGGQPEGFYVDVGASSPEESVTRAFSQAGWTGLNLEPLPELFEQVCAARPRDINLAVAASDRRGTATLFAAVGGLSTLDAEQSGRLNTDGHPTTPVEVPLVPLADLFAEHVTRTIDFLKVDVEGHERQVLAGNDWARWRPRVVLVEATEPNSPTPNHHGWEPILLAADYHFALFDGLNRFYVRGEDRDLIDRLAAPANYFDDYQGYAHHTALARLDDATAAAADLGERFHHLSGQFHTLSERHHTLTGEFHALGERHHTLSERHHALSQEFHTLSEQHHTLSEKTHGLAATHAELGAAHHALSHDHHELHQQHGALSRDHHELNQQHNALGHSHHELSQLHDALSRSHQDLNQRHDALGRTHHELNQQHDALSRRHHELNQLHHQLSQRYDAQTAKLAALTKEHERAAAESADRLAELEDARRQLATLREQHHTLSQHHHTLSQHHHEVSTHNEERRKQLEALTADHKRYSGWLGPFWWVCGRVMATLGLFRKRPA